MTIVLNDAAITKAREYVRKRGKDLPHESVDMIASLAEDIVKIYVEDLAQQRDEAKQLLATHCVAFIRDNNITSAETVYQSDRVIENAYEFIVGVCDIVGYAKQEEGDEA